MRHEETCSVEQAAQLAGVSQPTIRRWIHYGFVTATRVAPERGQWRIDRADLKKKLGLEREA